MSPSRSELANHIVNANPWAIRRILENKIADAITYTAPGGHVAVSTAIEANHVSVVIAATGRWPAGVLHLVSDANIASLTPSASGRLTETRITRLPDCSR